MKTFFTLKDLLDYCKKCPTCDKSRKIEISYAQENLAIVDCKESSNNLIIEAKYWHDIDLEENIGRAAFKTAYDYIYFHLDTLSGNCSVENYNSIILSGEDYKFVLDFNIYANCIDCFNNVNSSDIQVINLPDNSYEIYNYSFEIEQEGVWFLGEKQGFHVSFNPLNKNIIISEHLKAKTGDWLETGNEVKAPYQNIDFSNFEAAFQKIKLMMTFT